MSHLSKSKVSLEDDPLSLFGTPSSPTASSPPSSSSFIDPLSSQINEATLSSIREDLFKDFDYNNSYVSLSHKSIEDFSWIDSFDTLFGTCISSGDGTISKNQQRILLLHIWQQRSSSFSDTPPSPLRGLLWRYFFELVSSQNSSAWGEEMKEMTINYTEKKEKARPNIAKSSLDPLSALSQGLEPWKDYDKIVELNSIIEKDLDRLYLTGMDDLLSYDDFLDKKQDKSMKNDTQNEKTYELNFIVREFFQQNKHREILHHVLFTWCMQHENIFLGYRQGMHELVGILFLMLYQEQLHFFALGLQIMKKKYEFLFKIIKDLQVEVYGNETFDDSEEELIDIDDLFIENNNINSIKPLSKEEMETEKFLSISNALFSFFQPSGVEESIPSSALNYKNLMNDFLLSPCDANVLNYYKNIFRVRIDRKDKKFIEKVNEKLNQSLLLKKFNSILDHFYRIFTPEEFLLRLESHTYFLFSKLMKEMLPLYDTQGVTISHPEWEKEGGEIPYSDGDYSISSSQPFIVHYSSYIQYEFLPLFDQNVYNYLKECQIPSQVYALRWLRLLFSREFNVVEFNMNEYSTKKIALMVNNEAILKDHKDNILKMKKDFSWNSFCNFYFPPIEGILIKIWDILFASFFEYKTFLTDITKNSIDKNDFYSLFIQACVKEEIKIDESDTEDHSHEISSILSCVPNFKFTSSTNLEPYSVTPFIGAVGDIMLSMLLYLETSFYPSKDYNEAPDSSIAYMCLMKYPPFSLHNTSTVNENGQEFQNFNDLWESISMIHRGVFVIKDSLNGNILNFPSNSSLGSPPLNYSTFSISNSSTPSSNNLGFMSASKISSNIFSTLTEVNQNSKKFLSNFKSKVNNSFSILSPEFNSKKTSSTLKKTNWDDDDDDYDEESESEEEVEKSKIDFIIKKNINQNTALNSSEPSPDSNNSTPTFSSSYSTSSSFSSAVFSSSATNSSSFINNNKFNLFGNPSTTSYDSSVFSSPSPSSSPIDIIYKPFNILASQVKNLTTTVSSTFSKNERDQDNELSDIITPITPELQPEPMETKEKYRHSNNFDDWDFLNQK